MRPARRVTTWALGALALGAAWWLGQQGARLGAPPAPVVSAPAVAAPTAWIVPVPLPAPATPGTVPPPMPAPGARFVDAWPALLARAEAGDRVASCRLAMTAFRCSTENSNPADTDTPDMRGIEALPEDMHEPMVEHFAGWLESRVRDRAVCGGVDDALVQSFPSMLYRAARGSDDPHALALFADGSQSGRHLLFDEAGRRLHREHGGWAIDRLIALGEGHGLFLLMVGASDVRYGTIHSAVPEDRILLHAARELSREAGGERERSLAYANLDAGTQALVEARLDDLRARFGAERPAWHGEVPSPGMLPFLSMELTPAQLDAYCQVAIAQRTP